MGLMLEIQPSIGPALVVGGGTVAARKVSALVAAGFKVTVVAPDVEARIASQAGVSVWRREFSPSDVVGHSVAFACTGTRTVNRAVGIAAREAGLPVVVADSPEESTAFSPAVHRDGDLQVAVSTHGASPSLAVQVRDRIAEALGQGWDGRVDAARAAREARLAGKRAP
jgi:precorrin-2 dehydrogenase / sirohydrochlorin ferrochelatase